MIKYEYWLIDDREGTVDSHGFIIADRWEMSENDIVFYKGEDVEKSFPFHWLERLLEIETAKKGNE
jgi:hypothetical protein